MDYHLFLKYVVYVLYGAILARVVVSWIAPNRTDNPLVALIYQVTEPMLAPIRRIMPQTGMIDFSPMIVMIILSIVLAIVSSI